MTDFYHAGSRALQDRFDTRRLADRIEERLVKDRIGPDDKAFIEARDMFFLATVDARGQPSCSYKSGDPGFVRVVGACTLAFPCYDGNGMFLSMGNLAENRRVGMLFIDSLARSGYTSRATRVCISTIPFWRRIRTPSSWCAPR